MRFSIVTPAYNAANYLKEMLDSVRHQTFSDWELRIVDDGSTDDTRRIISETAAEDTRIKPVYLQENSGSCFHPRRLAIESSEGEYVVNIDADDMVEPDYLLKLDECIRTTGADLVYADMYLFGEAMKPAKVLPKGGNPYSRIYNGNRLFGKTLGRWEVAAVGALDRQLALKSLALYDSELTSEKRWNSYDNENLSRADLFLADKVALCQTAYYYRQTDQSVSHKISTRRFGLLSADMLLCGFTWHHFGPSSKEYVSANAQLFHHVIEFMRILRRHSRKLELAGAEKIVRKAFKAIDFSVLKGYVSPIYLAVMNQGYRTSKFILGRYGGN